MSNCNFVTEYFLLKTNINFKRIHQLAIPALIAGIAEPLISITDTAIIGNIDFNAKERLLVRYFCLFAANSGMRSGEQFNLHWRCVNTQTDKLDIDVYVGVQ